MNAKFSQSVRASDHAMPLSPRSAQQAQGIIAKQRQNMRPEQAALLFEWLLKRRHLWLGESTWMVARYASLNLKVPVSEAVVRQMRGTILTCVSMES